MNNYTKNEEIENPKNCESHLVILGAGASLAAFPKGDKNGKILPLMNNLVEVTGINEIFDRENIPWNEINFEDLYSNLTDSLIENKEILEEIEDKIYNYFSNLELPDEPTIYDHLILSLRKKDIIATFNWDPFLIQSMKRCSKITSSLPELIFLHGNVAVGICKDCKIMGVINELCRNCGNIKEKTKLLYPISKKDYSKDSFISSMWNDLDHYLNNSFMVTVFGYGAPKSDVEAIARFKNAWGSVQKREFEEIEIIDLKCNKELHSTWDFFIHTHHYSTQESFYDSQLAKHPRRSIEALHSRIFDARFAEGNEIKKDFTFDGLILFIKELLKFEKKNQNEEQMYTKPNMKYFIITTQVDKIFFDENGRQDKNKDISIKGTYAVESKNEVLPIGKVITEIARITTNKNKNYTWHILSVTETIRDDLEEFCVEWDFGRYLISV